HFYIFFFFSSRRRHTRFSRDWSSDVCSSDLLGINIPLSVEATSSIAELFGFKVPIPTCACIDITPLNKNAADSNLFFIINWLFYDSILLSNTFFKHSKML